MRKSLIAIKESFKTVWNSPFTIKFLLLLLFSCYTLKIFIYSTTNSLYNPEISELISPLYLYSFVLLICSGLILLIYFIVQKALIDYLIVGSILLISISICLELYEFFPCLFKHSNSYEDHLHPHTKEYILKQSFLCPSYSHRSRFNLIFFTGIGVTTFIISILIKRKKK
jgi:hypothetical protein